MPLFVSDFLDICDPVLTFDRFMEEINLEKYMKFPMFKKETEDTKYHEDPFRAVNFPIGDDGLMRCPNGKAFHLQYRQNVKGNAYGRQEEVYQCEDSSECSFAKQRTTFNHKKRAHEK